MDLCFKFVSDRFAESSQFDLACERIEAELAGSLPTPKWHVSSAEQITIHFEVLANSQSNLLADSEPENRRNNGELERLIRLLGELSTLHQIGWTVGHQMESDLATFLPGDSSSGWLEALRFEVRIAHSLAEMELDSKPSVQELGSSNRELETAPDEAWTSLLNLEQSFTRFPEWDE